MGFQTALADPHGGGYSGPVHALTQTRRHASGVRKVPQVAEQIRGV